MWMNITNLFHGLANEGDKITSMRFSKPQYRFMTAAKLLILVKLKELKEFFYSQKLK